ncbi:RAD55 family ATPase [Halovivax cerinus]|uniref:RAD55 family ATPase n=1 Tax=Halovivax cerinus TaxID=1487865 RepID=A0ABD5NSP8_9EURY|nr:transcriptional regulator [Halovivax cerinus]
MAGRLETGIDVLDRKLDGGLPPGCIVAFTASPASQSELLLYELTAARGTLYISTERSDDAIRHCLETSQARVGSPTIRQITGDDPVTDARRLVGALPDGANLIVDTMDVLEETPVEEYRVFLNELKTQMLETGSIAVLHCLKRETIPDNRTATLHMADAVFDLETNIGATELENFLTIPKFRAGGAPTERIKLEMADEMAIDTSRDIA